MCLDYSKQHTTRLRKRKTPITVYKIYTTTYVPEKYPTILLKTVHFLGTPLIEKNGIIRSNRPSKKLLNIELQNKLVSKGIHVYLREPSLEKNQVLIVATAEPKDLVAVSIPYPWMAARTWKNGNYIQQYEAAFMKIKVSPEIIKTYLLNTKGNLKCA